MCRQVLQMEPEHDAATVMLADVAYRTNNYQQAVFHFKQLLGKIHRIAFSVSLLGSRRDNALVIMSIVVSIYS